MNESLVYYYNFIIILNRNQTVSELQLSNVLFFDSETKKQLNINFKIACNANQSLLERNLQKNPKKLQNPNQLFYDFQLYYWIKPM